MSDPNPSPSYRTGVGHGYSHDGDLYLDADDNRYTTSVMATRGDPWWGATILTRSTVAALRRDGRLPLTEVVCLWNHDRLTRRARRGWREIVRRLRANANRGES